jgi:hypothetical protein
MAAYSGLAAALAPLRAEHQEHLAELRSRVIEPPGEHVTGRVTARPALGSGQGAVLRQLRAAEQSAVTALMGRLSGASPSLAQLYASIAACEATHASLLGARVAA